MNRTFCRRVLPVILLSISCHASADTIKLKNGRTIDGIVIEESEDKVVVDIGAGTATFGRKNVAAIERSSNQEQDKIKGEWKKKYFLSRKNVPNGLETMADQFLMISATRDDAVRARKTMSQQKEDERKIQAEMEDMEKQLVDLSRKLAKASPKQNLEAYNALVLELNSIRAKLTVKNDELQKAAKNRISTLESISNYQTSLQAFQSSFLKESEARPREKRTEDETYFLDGVSNMLAGLDHEFATVTVETSSTPHGNTMVAAVVNGEAGGKFLVDTGAALVTVTEAFAKRLKLDTSAQPATEAVLADGRKVAARAVILKSVQVGDARVEDVQALVLGTSVGDGMDGLLGMSFLRNFAVQLDGATGRLILKQFAPK